MKPPSSRHGITLSDIHEAYDRVRPVITQTPLMLNARLSSQYGAEIYLKREDLQVVRSYKIRGAYNLIGSLSRAERAQGVVAASAGNHAQGVALSCALLKVQGRIFMPRNTPKQKIERVGVFGGKWVELEIIGDTFDEASGLARAYAAQTSTIFVPPFDDVRTIAGQATVAHEIWSQLGGSPDIIVAPIGGGGLISGLATYSQLVQADATIYGAEPEGVPSMYESLRQGKVVTIENINTFVDGAAVKTPGKLTFEIVRDLVKTVYLVPEGKICTEMIKLYQSDGIIAEPAGALAIAALDKVAKAIAGKKVVVIVSGGNNDIARYSEVIERSLVYEGLKHYFIVNFPQRPGALRRFLDDILGEHDDITLFEYLKRSNRDFGPALVGLELGGADDLPGLLQRMAAVGIAYEKVEPDSPLFRFIV